MTTSVVLIVIGLILLIAGGELLLRGSVAIATLAQVTPAVIGLTVVAAGTSVPELAVSLIAAMKGSPAVAVGNVVGSNIFNLTLILGLAAVIRPLVISGNTIKLEYPVLVLVSLLYLVVSGDGTIGRLDSFLFVMTYIGFTAYMIFLVRKQLSVREEHKIQIEVKELNTGITPQSGVWVSLALVALGVLLLVVGAHETVTGAIEVGRALGMSERVIGLTIVAGGTGLPEVVTSLVSSIRGRDDVAIGNVIGSNLFNILGVLGLNGLIQPIQIPSDIVTSDNLWMFGLTLFLLPLLFTGLRIARSEGVLLLVAYGIYLSILIGRA